jgi:hypothetical protein
VVLRSTIDVRESSRSVVCVSRASICIKLPQGSSVYASVYAGEFLCCHLRSG